MTRDSEPWSRATGRIAVLTAAVALAACGGTGGVGDQPEPDATLAGQAVDAATSQSTVDLPAASDDTTAPTGTDDGGTSGFDLCSAEPGAHGYLVEIGLLEEEDLAGLPVPYDLETEGYWSVDPLGPDGAYAVGEGLVDGWVCDLDVSPAVAGRLDEYLEEVGGDISIDEIEAIVGDEAGIGADAGDGSLDVLSPQDLKQLTRDYLYAAGLAERVGNLERSEHFKDLARDVHSAFSEIALNDATDPKVLMDAMAGAQLLGMDDLSEEIGRRIDEILKEQLADAATLFNECTTDPNVVRAYVDALKRARIWDTEAGDGRYEHWLDVQERRARDEPVPECKGGVFAVVEPLPGWDGTLDVQLSTCGFIKWTGRVVAAGALAEAGGTMTIDGTIPLEILFSDQDDREGVGDFASIAEVTLTTPDATGEGGTYLTGKAFFTQREAGWELELFFDAGTFDLSIEAAGMTIKQSRPIDWGERLFVGTVEPFDSACAE